MNTISKRYKIKASPKEVWECLTNQNEMNKWGAKPSFFKAKIGSNFNMWGDYLKGAITNLKEFNSIEEDWIVDGMTEPSKVKFKLIQKDNLTILELFHSNVPESLVKELSEGWDMYYLGAIKQYLEK